MITTGWKSHLNQLRCRGLRFTCQNEGPDPSELGEYDSHEREFRERLTFLSSPSISTSTSFEPGAATARTGRIGGTGDNFYGTPLDEQCLSVNQGIGDLFMGGFEDSAERLARNAHFLCGIGLVEPFKIGQTDRLELIDG